MEEPDGSAPRRGIRPTTPACPDCGDILVHAQACMACRSCGYSRCG